MTEHVPIDSGIPLPPKPPRGRKSGFKLRYRYPWGQLQIGQSFVYHGTCEADAFTRASTAIWSRPGFDRNEYEVRRMDGIVRIWRVR